MNLPKFGKKLCVACKAFAAECVAPVGEGSAQMCWSCAHHVVDHGVAIEDAPTAECECAPKDVYATQTVAFTTKCLAYRPELLKVAARVCRDADAARDLVQDTLLSAMSAWDTFRPGTNMRAWLFRILTNAFINSYRKRQLRKRHADEHFGDLLSALHGRDQDFVDGIEPEPREDLSDEVRGALARLQPEQREIVERADLHDQSYKAIADELNVPIGTVMSRLFRARRALEAELAGFAASDYGIKRVS